MNVVLLTKAFETHRCDGTKDLDDAFWFSTVGAATRFYPLIEPFVPADTPDSSKVFHCPACSYIAIVPIKQTR